jgi:hypothetical protein
MGGSLWFITPAWGRYEIVSVCLEQRRRAIEELAKGGIEAHQVVIADDDNLDIARAVGADVVECPNFEDGHPILGRKWNLGMQHAAKKGADWFVQIGSDSWVDPAFFMPLVAPRYTLTSPAYCAVTTQMMAQLSVSPRDLQHSAGPYVFHRSLLTGSNFAPCEERSVMTDTSTVQGIEKTARIRWLLRTRHPFQYVGFRVEPLMTSYRALAQRWLVHEIEPWGRLKQFYPWDLVEAARKVMGA